MSMTPLTAPAPLSIVDQTTGELIEISTGPLTLEEAAARLPFAQRMVRELRRFETFLLDSIAASFTEGQTEKRIGEALFEMKPEAAWIIDDEGALFALLHAAVARDEITEAEFGEACAQLVTYRWHNGRLTTLARRLPSIDQHRHRVEGPAKLRQKA
jgi:hypothetical protein